jgi:putative sterol carrier protein
VAEHLSPEWIDALGAAAADAEAPDGIDLVVQQIVLDADRGEVAYAVRVTDGTVSVQPGRVDDADITFTQDRATATAIARGELSAQSAFLEGRLKVGGDLSAALAAARVLSGLGDVFASPRAATAWVSGA